MKNTLIQKAGKTATAGMMALLLLASSCKKSDIQSNEAPVSAERLEELRSQVATSTGFPISSIVYNAAKKTFTVANDGQISLQDAQARFPHSEIAAPSQGQGMKQRVYTYTVTASNAANITFFADNTVPAEWITALDQAIANWNSTNSLVHMQRVTTGTTTSTTTTGNSKKKKPGSTTTTSTPSYNVLVTTMYDANTSTVAQAYYPDNYGNAGKSVTINTYYNYLSSSYKTFAITHELGHTIGFTHTDGTYGALITGTPETDPNSVMNSFVLPWNGFTPYDVTAVTTVYPR